MFSYADKQREPRFQKFDEGRAHGLVRSICSFTPKYYKKFCHVFHFRGHKKLAGVKLRPKSPIDNMELL